MIMFYYRIQYQYYISLKLINLRRYVLITHFILYSYLDYIVFYNLGGVGQSYIYCLILTVIINFNTEIFCRLKNDLNRSYLIITNLYIFNYKFKKKSLLRVAIILHIINTQYADLDQINLFSKH